MNAEEFYLDRWKSYVEAGIIRHQAELGKIDAPLVEGVRSIYKKEKKGQSPILPPTKGEYSLMRDELLEPFLPDRRKNKRISPK